MSRSSCAWVAIAFATLAAPSLAQPNYFWNGGSGSFGSSSNWSFGVTTPAGPPAAGDRALFLTGTTPTVSGNGSPAQVIVQSPLVTFTGVISPQGNVTGFPTLTNGLEIGVTALGRTSFSGSGAALNSARPVVVGDSAEGTLIFNLGAQGSSAFFGTTPAVSVASSPAGLGHFLLSGDNTTFTANGPFLIGGRGIGDASVTVNAKLSTSGVLASSAAGLNIGGSISGATGAQGTLTIGSGGEVSNTLQTNIGLYGKGTVNISGGKFTSTDGGTDNPAIAIARFAGSEGHLTVSGTGHVISEGHLIVGGGAAGDLTITQSGLVDTKARVNVPAIVGFGTGATGLATVDGVDAQWNVTNALVVGQLGTGTIELKNGGTLFVERTDLINDPYLHISDDAGSNGTIKVTDEFSFLDASLIPTRVGYDALSTGRLEIANLGLASLARTAIGSSGAGTLDLKTGGQLITGTALVGEMAGGNGAATMATNSLWHVAGQLYVGAEGTGSLVVSNTVTLTVDEFISVGDGLNGNGVLTIDGATATVNGSLSSVYLGYAGQGELRLKNGATWSVTGAATLGEIPEGTGIANIDATSKWNLSGSVTVGGSPAFAGGEGQLNITGQATAGTTVKVWDQGVVTLINGGKLNASQVNLVGKLAGQGTVTATTTTNNGVIAPDHGAGNTGQLNITGALAQSSLGTVKMDIGGTTPSTTFDKLTVTGAATLAGTVDVSLANGFAPTLGQSFDLLDWGSVSGAFTTFFFPALNPGLAWNATQLSTTGVLSVGLAGDYNANGVVDAADYTRYRDSLNTNTLLPNDLTPGSVTAADYAVWQANFGAGAPSAASAVPEPSSALLLLAMYITSRIATRSGKRHGIA